jgi:hypothetical protein
VFGCFGGYGEGYGTSMMGAVEGKWLVGGGSGEAGTAMQMQGLSAITPVTLLSG